MNEIENRVIQLCKELKKSGEKGIYNTIAEIIESEYDLKCTGEVIRSISRRYRNRNGLDENFEPISEVPDKDFESVTLTIDEGGNTTSEKKFSIPHGEALTPKLLLEKHGFDSNKFELVSARNSRWNIQQKGSVVTDMYSSKITVRPSKDFIWSKNNIEQIFENIKIKKYAPPRKRTVIDSDRCLIVPISDLHLGMLSEKKVTGNDYNLEIAESLYYYVINDILNEVGEGKFNKVIFVVGNDFINSDNITNTTTKGTPQDASNMWHTVVDKATELCINGIDMLKTIAPVDVVYAVSNHDYHTMYGIMKTLDAYYRFDEDVTIFGDPSERKYFQLGEVIIGISHDIKPDKGLELMSVEAHEMWSECKTMIWFLGHLHTQMAYQKKGYVEVLRLPTVSGWSRWSNKQGYVQTERKNQAFIIDYRTGIKNTINTVIKL